MLSSELKEFAKKTGYKNKKGLWFDRQGFICEEREIVDYYNELKKIFQNQEEKK